MIKLLCCLNDSHEKVTCSRAWGHPSPVGARRTGVQGELFVPMASVASPPVPVSDPKQLRHPGGCAPTFPLSATTSPAVSSKKLEEWGEKLWVPKKVGYAWSRVQQEEPVLRAGAIPSPHRQEGGCQGTGIAGPLRGPISHWSCTVVPVYSQKSQYAELQPHQSSAQTSKPTTCTSNQTLFLQNLLGMEWSCGGGPGLFLHHP
jgi:hypothetical protein